jgi:O-antigen ligase
MARLGTTQLPKPTGRLPWPFSRWYMPSKTSFVLLQWLIVVAMAFVLAFYSLVAFSSPLAGMLLVSVIVAAPFLVVIAASLAGHLQRLLLITILIDVFLNIDYNYKFNETLAYLDTVTGYNISLTTLCLAALYAIWFIESVQNRHHKVDSPATSWLQMSRPLIVYAAIVVFSMIMARSVTIALVEVNLLFQAILLYIYIIHAIRSKKDLLLVVTLFLIGLFLESLIMIGGRAVGTSLDLVLIDVFVDEGSMRVGGTIGAPNSAGAYLTLMLIISFSVLATQLGRWYKRLAILAFGPGVLALILTLSRGAWLSLAVALTLYWFLAWRRGWMSLKIPIAMAIVAIPVVIGLGDLLLARLFVHGLETTDARMVLIRLTQYMLKDHWLFGVGANNYGITMFDYITPEFSMEWIKTVHNRFLIVWTETGIFGLLAFLWFLLSTIHRGWQVWKVDDRFLAPLALGLTLSVVAWMIHMNFEHFHNRPQVQLLLLVAGLIVATYNIASASRELQPT